MKLQELATPSKTQMIAKTLESYFNADIDVGRLNAAQTDSMLAKVQSLIREHKTSVSRHTSEKNPAYLKLVMIEQALVSRLSEMAPTAGAVPVANGQSPKPANGNLDPKVKAARDKVAKGQTLSQEEQNTLNQYAASVTESRLRRAYHMLKESEVQQAQVVLAAQDMVDKMQGMLEDVSELQFKELPALVDSIKNQVGMDQATQFNTDATAALTGLLQNIQGAKQQMEAALGVVTGQGAPSAAGAEFGADMAADAAAMNPAAPAADVAPPIDAAPVGEEPPMASDSALGRQRR